VAIRKSVEDTFVVSGSRDEWLQRGRTALEDGGFTKVQTSDAIYELSGNYKKLTVWGDIRVTLVPEGDSETRIIARATANIDNVFSLFRSPGRAILDQFKGSLYSSRSFR
jgi:hypothetical protein